MPSVYTFNRSENEILQELLRVFSTGNGTSREQWILQAELLVEPVGWDALWKLSKDFCKKFEVRFPCIACVTVTSVDFETLSACVDVLSVQHESVSLPEMVEDVPLIELWPTTKQREQCINATTTAEFIDLMRFYYNNIWMPWDDQDEKVLLPNTIEDRMRLWSDLHNGTIPNCVARSIVLLRNSAINAYEKLKELDTSLCETGLVDEDDSMLPPNYIILCAEMTARLDSHMSKWTLYEKSIIREQYLAKVRSQWQKNKSRRNVVALWQGGSISEFTEIARYLDSLVTEEQTLTVTAQVEEAIELEPEQIVLCSGAVELPEAALSHLAIVSHTGTVIKTSDMRSCLLMLSEDCELRDVTLSCARVNTALLMRAGTLHVRRCALRDDSSSHCDFAQGIVAMAGAKILIEETTFENFYTGIVVHKGAQVELRNCTIRNCGVGIQMYSGSALLLNSTTISGCAESSVRCEVDEHAKSLLDMEGLQIMPNCTVGSGNLQKEVLIVRQDVDLIPTSRVMMTPKLEVLVNKKKQGGYHLGKLILDFFMERPPDGICQIDAGTGDQETYSSVISRSVRLARRLRRDGFGPGDVLMLGGRNHLDIHIPFYAAHFNGQPVVGVDPFYMFDEIKFLFNTTKPKVAFCQRESYDDYSRAAAELGLDIKIVTFDGGECSFRKYLEEYEDDEPIEEFKVADFDMDSVFAWLVSTSGTSGVPKVAAFHHRTLVDVVLAYMKMTPPRESSQLMLNLSPVQWISAYFNALGMVMNHTALQTSKPTDDLDHVIDIINKYKPTSTFASPALFASIVKSENPCDLTCFKMISLSGSKIYKQLIIDLKARMSPDAVLMEYYGQTESLGSVLRPNPAGPIGNCGVPMPMVQLKLVDPETGNEITTPNVIGELWTKGPRFACYYNNPEETAKAITKDGWYRTGDLLYRDEDNNYFYVDRLSMLIKYRGNHVDPPEVEEVITAHPDVLDVCVTGIPHPEDCEHTVACVVLRPGSSLTAQDIKEMVAEKLSAGKRLHGGVVFMAELPKTSTGKVVRAKLKKMVPTLNRE